MRLSFQNNYREQQSHAILFLHTTPNAIKEPKKAALLTKHRIFGVKIEQCNV